MILGSWSRQELTDYPGNGRGGGVMVSRGQIHTRTATFVKFRSCAPCRNTLSTTEVHSEPLCANTCSPPRLHLSSAVRVGTICRKGRAAGGDAPFVSLTYLHDFSRAFKLFFFYKKGPDRGDDPPIFGFSQNFSFLSSLYLRKILLLKITIATSSEAALLQSLGSFRCNDCKEKLSTRQT